MDLDNKDSSEKESNYVSECTKLFDNILRFIYKPGRLIYN